MIEFINGYMIIKCPEIFDFRIIDNLEKEVNDYVEAGKARMVMDLSKCIFIDSASLSFIVRMYKKCLELGGCLKICSLKHPKVFKIFQLTKLDEILIIYEDLSEALKS